MLSLLAAVLIGLPANAGVIAVPRGSIPALTAPVILSGPAVVAPALNGSLSAPSLNTFWDGIPTPSGWIEPALAPSAAIPLAAGFDAPEPERAAAFLVHSDPKAAAALDRAVDLARTTRAGRKALDEAERVLAEQGRTLDVLVEPLGRNYGEYDYVEKNMRLHSGLFKPGREADLAGTLVHELTHVVQHSLGIPSNAVEMEVEAHLQDLQMLEELGLKPPPHTFARQAYDALRESPKKFVELIQAAVPGTVSLGESSFDDIEEQLEQDLADAQKKAKRSKASAGLAQAIAADLDLLRTPEGRAAYKSFSRRVFALLKRRAAEAK